MPENHQLCDGLHDHGNFEIIEQEFLSDDEFFELADLFKMFGDSTRLKIIYSLYSGELCVCDIARLLNMSQSAVSHQLRVLKSAHLLKFRKQGKEVLYSLADDHVKTILSKGKEHIEE